MKFPVLSFKVQTSYIDNIVDYLLVNFLGFLQEFFIWSLTKYGNFFTCFSATSFIILKF